MTITAKHIAWSIIIIALLIPWYPFIFMGHSLVGTNSVSDIIFLHILDGVRSTEIVITSAMLIFLLLMFFIDALHGRVNFSIHIPLPKFRKSRISEEDRERFYKLGTIDPKSDEFNVLYSEMKEDGLFD